ncbi:MAG: hypothetical protein H6953_05700 [Chromatiaceae bacterium]|nr:hypothetical protein [Gammaproteobacteria bacterium]MCP5304919.1 hypothetical protein [Chromatiaceae bacterium]MCP5314878.1 hypothetical protein [Chromatiaceae bacterium]
MTLKDLILLILILAAIAANLLLQPAAAADGSSWELKQLHHPSTSLLRAEDAGRVTIYDGLMVSEVDRAMDQQFDRIDSMMFVRTKRPVESGGFIADSDCD